MLGPLNERLERKSMFGTALIALLVLMALSALPTWSQSRSWGYYPSGGIGLVLIVLMVLLWAGRI